MTKRNPSDLGYIEDRWFDDSGKPKVRNGQGKRYLPDGWTTKVTNVRPIASQGVVDFGSGVVYAS